MTDFQMINKILIIKISRIQSRNKKQAADVAHENLTTSKVANFTILIATLFNAQKLYDLKIEFYCGPIDQGSILVNGN